MTDPRCGSLAGYQEHITRATEPCTGCRVGMAKAKATYRRARYLLGPLKIDATGTRRRLRALARMGWSAGSLGAQLGVSGSAVTNYATERVVHRDTAATVAELYDRLWDQPGPSNRVRLLAAKRGWPGPLAFDDDTIDRPDARPRIGAAWSDAFDEVAVLRAMYGDPVRLRPSERAEATRRLTAAGLSAAQIAERLGCTKRSVVRQRNRTEEVA